MPLLQQPASFFIFRTDLALRPPRRFLLVQCRSMSSSSSSSSSSSCSLEERYCTNRATRKAKGVAIAWFRNDLRLTDNEALYRAWSCSECLLPVYCVDPRIFGAATHDFGFPKTGELRAKFILEGLVDLRRNLQKRGLDLYVEYGKPENILPRLAELTSAHTVFAQKETCSEELKVEKLVKRNIEKVKLNGGQALSETIKSQSPRLELVWGTTMYHLNDLPFTIAQLPDVYTQFRKLVESRSTVRPCFKVPTSLAPPPKCFANNEVEWGSIPTLEQMGLEPRDQSSLGVLHFVGGETAAFHRLHDYFWVKDRLRIYKETRNGMLGAEYSTKFSPWLAAGFISPRLIYEEVKRYEKERVSNDSTYWVLFELLWRDYFRFLSIKYGDAIFHLEGPRKVKGINWSQNERLFESWRTGSTGYPLIDANMKELMSTGFMSNRGRQIVCSFLVRDMGIDWRMGAEWFESCLLDYDPCSNYGNWTYGAGVGNDPREDRYFSIPKQAQNYDPDGEYVAHWIPEIARLPKFQRHSPGLAYIKPVVSLKFGGNSCSSRSFQPPNPRVNNNRGGDDNRSTRGRGRGRGRGQHGGAYL